MEAERREKIVHSYLENPLWSASRLAKQLKLPRNTVWRVIKRYKETLTTIRKPQANRRSGTVDRKLRGKILKTIKRNPNLSDRDLARKFGAAHSTVRRTRLREGIKSYRASKQPNRTIKQNSVAKIRARKLYDQVLTKFDGCLLMDDETYVKADFGQIPGQKFYLATARGDVPAKFKFVFADKFARKFMIWQGICSCGKKTKVFVTNKTMTSELYQKECLQKRILPFIRSHDHPVMFWPDLASCHYSKVVQEWYAEKGVQFVPKNLNPPNCPQFRPIEKYWAIMKRRLKAKGKVVKDINQMKTWWNKIAKTMDEEGVRRLMSRVTGKIREFLRNRDE